MEILTTRLLLHNFKLVDSKPEFLTETLAFMTCNKRVVSGWESTWEKWQIARNIGKASLMKQQYGIWRVYELWVKYTQFMAYLPTFGQFLWWMWVNIPYTLSVWDLSYTSSWIFCDGVASNPECVPWNILWRWIELVMFKSWFKQRKLLKQHSINTQTSATVQYISIKMQYSTSSHHWGHMDLIFHQLGNKTKTNWTLHQNWWDEIFQRQLAFRFSPIKEFTWNSHEHPIALNHRSEICHQIQNHVFGPHNVCN